MRKLVYSICEHKGADQPAHPRSLISAFVVQCLDSIIPLVSISEISSLYLASVSVQASLSLTLVANPEDRFSHDKAQFILLFISTKTQSYRTPSITNLMIDENEYLLQQKAFFENIGRAT